MREIKFRAWVKQFELENHLMLPVYVINIDEAVLSVNPGGSGGWRSLDEVKLMQFTGLKDIDKKELYDGDFFKDDEGMLYLIEWDAGGLQWYAVDVLNNGEWSMNLGEFINTRIVYQGNQFENPELLTSQQGSGKAG